MTPVICPFRVSNIIYVRGELPYLAVPSSRIAIHPLVSSAVLPRSAGNDVAASDKLCDYSLSVPLLREHVREKKGAERRDGMGGAWTDAAVTAIDVYIIFIGLLAFPILLPDGNLSAIDAYHFGVSASTESGLNTSVHLHSLAGHSLDWRC